MHPCSMFSKHCKNGIGIQDTLLHFWSHCFHLTGSISYIFNTEGWYLSGQSLKKALVDVGTI